MNASTLPISILTALVTLTTACSEPLEGRARGEDDRASSDFCAQDGSFVGQGILALVNDPDVDAALLDLSVSSGGAGLYSNAANNIIDARPFASLADLDAVPYVGNSACESLARFACNEQGRCQAPLSMVSWNIEHFPMTEDTQDAVIELIGDMQPDIIGVQEIQDRDAFNEMLEELPEYSGAIGERGYFTRVGIIYRHTTVDIETEDLFVDDSYNFPRSVLAADVEVLGAVEPTSFKFAVVHLKAFGDSRSVSRRRAAIADLRAWVDEERSEGHEEIVIVGDWNDKLTDTGDANVFTELTEDDAGGQFLTWDAAEAGESSYVPFTSLIDHIWASDETLDTFEYDTTDILYFDETWSDDYEDVVSDHRPVRSNFEIVVRYEQ